MGHPILIHLHQSLDGLHKVFHGDIGHTHTVSGVVAALGVAVRAEELDLAFCGTICLQTFEDLLCIVEHHGSRVHLEGLIGDDSGVMPAVVRIVVHDEHMVGKFLAEAQFALISRLCLRGLSQFNTDIQHKRCLPNQYQSSPFQGNLKRGRSVSLLLYHTTNQMTRLYRMIHFLPHSVPFPGLLPPSRGKIHKIRLFFSAPSSIIGVFFLSYFVQWE